MLKKFIASAAIAASLWSAGVYAQTTQPADLVLANGKVYTPTGWSQAIAVRGNVIVAVGTDAEVASLKGSSTKVIDLGGKAVFPGLQDMHVHVLGGGPLHVSGCFIKGESNQKQILARIKQCISAAPKGKWIQAGMFDPNQFEDRSSMRKLLDSVSPNNPVTIQALDGHTVWANSKALAAGNVTAATPSPPGGVIFKDAKGQPTGILNDTAAWLLSAAAPRPTPEELDAGIEWASRQFASFGVTSFTEAASSNGAQAVFAKLSDKGTLLQRTRICNMWMPDMAEMTDDIRDHNIYARKLLDTACVKIFSDGTSTQSHTGAMLEPYIPNKANPKADDHGMLMMPTKVLADALTRFDRDGLTVKVHACGDAAVKETLDAYEAMRKANGFTRMQEVAHFCFSRQEDLERVRGLGLTAEISAYLWSPSDPINQDMLKAVGPERMKHFFPIGSAVRSGANVTLGSDWPCVELPSPWLAIESAVTRRPPGEPDGRIDAPDERVTLKEAIDLMTLNGARQLGLSDKIGRIEKGMIADIAVLDRNPFEVPITEVGKTKALLTLVDGRIVYQDGI